MAGWGNFFGKIADQFQGRIERLKNEKAKLEKEKGQILRGPCTDETAARVSKINKRLAEFDQILVTKAAD